MSVQRRYVEKRREDGSVYIVDTEKQLAVKSVAAPVVHIFEECPEKEKITGLLLSILNMKGRFGVYIVPEEEQEEKGGEE